ncbi:MAG TPA: tetratricopeptide repeat protein [bacterium]|nr:tetratricopeptide repeat protein [bacterium]
MQNSIRFRARVLLFAYLFGIVALIAASDFQDNGIRLFMENKPAEAAPVLEQAAKEAGADEKVFLYLGIAYQQLNRWDDAIAAFRKGLGISIQYRHMFLFNIANSFFAQGRNAFSLEYYDQTIAAKNDFAPAYLNRANARMRLGDQAGASADYSLYLSLEPGSVQAAEIRRLLDLLGAKATAAAQAKALAEAQKLAEEQARQAMLDSVAQSLLQAAESTTNLSAGSGDVQSYDSDTSLDD